jgi:hypothetical protein
MREGMAERVREAHRPVASGSGALLQRSSAATKDPHQQRTRVVRLLPVYTGTRVTRERQPPFCARLLRVVESYGIASTGKHLMCLQYCLRTYLAEISQLSRTNLVTSS